MPRIRPISDLRNHFTDIANEVHQSSEPVFLTKNGYGHMVVMSMEAYEAKNFESEIYTKLKEAEQEAASSDRRLSHSAVIKELRAQLAAQAAADV